MDAIKYDGDKPMLSLVPSHAINGMGRALTYGAKKYANFNYKQGDGLDWDRYSSALLRHLFAWLGGEDKDPESGLNHIDHVLACAGMLGDAVYSKIGKDTRFKTTSDYDFTVSPDRLEKDIPKGKDYQSLNCLICGRCGNCKTCGYCECRGKE
jgi:hypothetical protein